MKKFRVGIIGATGMVGQRFASLIAAHPWFDLSVVAASPRSAGKSYADATNGRWLMDSPCPPDISNLIVYNAIDDINLIADNVDFVFSAVDMNKSDIFALEEAYAKRECPVVSNNSAHRFTPDVPMVIPEVNPEHIRIIDSQRNRLGSKRGFIAVKSNCSIQSYVPALHPLAHFGINRVLVCTYQAISGAGKTFDSWPDIIDNVIPFIGGEEDKSENEPLKVWGHIHGASILNATAPSITSQCIRVPVSDGHLAAVFASFDSKPPISDILSLWDSFKSPVEHLNLPSAPKKFLRYFPENDRPQTRLDRNLDNGMAISIGRLREDSHYHYKFVSLSHNTLRGAAGGAVLLAELLCASGYISLS